VELATGSSRRRPALEGDGDGQGRGERVLKSLVPEGYHQSAPAASRRYACRSRLSKEYCGRNSLRPARFEASHEMTVGVK